MQLTTPRSSPSTLGHLPLRPRRAAENRERQHVPRTAGCARWGVVGTAQSWPAASASAAPSPTGSSDRCCERPVDRPAPVGGFQVPVADVAVSAWDSRQVVFLEKSDPGDLEQLPGFVGMPVVTFDLPPKPFLVVANLGWEFHVQVEGENAGLLIGHTPQAPSCAIHHPQWFIRET
jgi:hypothetical protein